MNKKLIVGNWKMNPVTLDEAKKIAGKIKRVTPTLSNVETVIAPPLPFIIPCGGRNKIKHFSLGAQSASVETDRGPHTGEVSATILGEIGVEYVIVGHSEQRKSGETDEVVSRKVKAILGAGLSPIVCVGEMVHDESGDYLNILKNQIKNSLANVEAKSVTKIVLAYEPVWAIGATEPMKNEDIYESSLFVKKVFSDLFGPEAGVKVKVLYGGSVNYRNAGDIVRVGKVDGLLVGRESVNVPGFVELLKAVDNVG